MKEELFQIVTTNYPIKIGSILSADFEVLLTQKYKNSKKIILVDENTNEDCLDYLITNFEDLKEAEIIVLPAGEENKCLEICEQVWETFLEYEIERNDVLINLGGGVITDIGGFIASLYKRGIDFINVPTSLLAMIDASVGGKTGVDFNNYKNVIGIFSNPKAIFIDNAFLDTLPEIDKIGGWIEMIKHGLIADKNHWDELKKNSFHPFEMTNEMIFHSIEIKHHIVERDPFERGERKILNFGHTFGHALESYLLEQNKFINHGVAVGVGIIIESYWSWKKSTLSEKQFMEIKDVIMHRLPLLDIHDLPVDKIWGYMRNDKKNHSGKVFSVLLNQIGTASYDNEVSYELLIEALDFYHQITQN